MDTDKGFGFHGFDNEISFQTNNDVNNWKTSTFLSLTNLNQETAGYIDTYTSSLRESNLNPEAYRDAKSFRLNTIFSKAQDDYYFQLRPFLRTSKMNFIQHYLPGQPIEKNKQTTSGINFFMDVNSFINQKLSFGINLEIASIDLEEFMRNQRAVQ